MTYICIITESVELICRVLYRGRAQTCYSDEVCSVFCWFDPDVLYKFVIIINV